MFRKPPLFLLALPLLLLSSCIEGEEEVWINQDASGRVKARYSIPPLAMKQIGVPEDYVRAIKLVDEREDGIAVQHVSFETIKGRVVFELQATFDNALDLLEIAKRSEQVFVDEANANPNHLDALSGEIDVGMETLNPFFSRQVALGGLFPTMVRKSPKMLGKSNFKYTIHLPVEVKETNAHEISDDKRTVSWTFLLKEYAEDPMVMKVKTAFPLPWWILTLLALILFFVIWLIWKRRKRRLHRSERKA